MIIHSKKLLGATDHGVFEYKVPGTYTLTFKRKTRATVYMVGAGGASGFQWFYLNYWMLSKYAGGSGAGFIGDIYIPEGTLTIKVGAASMTVGVNADTSITSSTVAGTLITAGGRPYSEGMNEGHGGSRPYKGSGYYLNGLLNISINADIIEGTVLLNTNGNYGEVFESATALGGASVYQNYGRGADYLSNQGENAGLTNATDGYFKIIY